MPSDTASPSRIFVRALAGEQPDPQQLATLDPYWQDLIQLALDATPAVRRATLVTARAGQTDLEALRTILTSPESQASDHRPWPEPTPFGRPRLPEFPYHVLPHWLGDIVRAEATATQTPPDLAGMLALAVLSTACAGRVILNPWGDWLEPLNLYLMVALPPGHRKSAVFASIVQPLQQYEVEAAQSAAPQIAQARRIRHAAEQALIRAEAAVALASDDRRRDALLQIAQQRADDLAAVDPPVVPRLIVDDCSPERLAMLLHQQGGRLAILSPEGGIFDLIAGRYSTTGAPNLDHFLKGHAGDP